MSRTVAVVTDSTADLPPERAAELGIAVVPLSVHLDGVSYQDGVDLLPAAFYDKLQSAKDLPSTSQPSAGQFQQVYESIPASEIISIHISERLSGTCNSARAAATQVPGKRIEVIDSRTVSLALGYLAQAAAEAVRQNASFEDVCGEVRRRLGRTGFLAVLDTLHFARRSGRIGFAQALIGSMLQVKPIITIADGAVEPAERPRTMRKAVERLVELTVCYAPFDYLAVPHANNEAVARQVADELARIHSGPIDVVLTGAVVGTHCGPGAVATCWIGR